MQNKIILGLTGPTGAGKSTVAAYLREAGIEVLDGDQISREVTTKGSLCLKELTDAFSSDILFEDGSLNRRKLGSIAFADPEKLAALNQITHKYITAEMKERIQKSNAKIICIDAAALYESKIDRMCDKVLVVTADEETRKKRIISRDGLSEEEALKRMRAQKVDYAAQDAVIIENNADASALLERVGSLLVMLEDMNDKNCQ